MGLKIQPVNSFWLVCSGRPLSYGLVILPQLFPLLVLCMHVITIPWYCIHFFITKREEECASGCEETLTETCWEFASSVQYCPGHKKFRFTSWKFQAFLIYKLWYLFIFNRVCKWLILKKTIICFWKEMFMPIQPIILKLSQHCWVIW